MVKLLSPKFEKDEKNLLPQFCHSKWASLRILTTYGKSWYHTCSQVFYQWTP